MTTVQIQNTDSNNSNDTTAKAIEVAAMLGDSVINVKHCMDPKGGTITATTIGMVAAGAACLLASAVAFAVSVNTAANNKAGLETWTRTLHKPAYAYRAATVSSAVDAFAFGGAGLGLLGVTMGLARMRRERKSPYYRIGTAPGVELPIDTAPSANFPLVAPRGDDFVLNLGAGMHGEMIVDGKSTSLADLAAQARPSTSAAGAIELPIPARARISVKSGKTTFVVSAVAKPEAQPTTMFGGLEGRTFKYAAGSLAVHLGIVAFLSTIPVEDSGVNLTLGASENLAVHVDGKANDEAVVEPTPDSGQKAGSTTEATSMALAGGAKTPAGQQQQIRNNNAEPQLTREQAMEAARDAGWMGSTALRSNFRSLTGDRDLSSDVDSANVYDGTPNGDDFGNGPSKGPGRCTIEPCGVTSTGPFKTIGPGGPGGDEYKIPGRIPVPVLPPHDNTVPKPTFGPLKLDGDMDKQIIKRYMKRAAEKISYCYEKRLMAKPSLAGDLMVTFFINPDGSVKTATATGFDNEVGSCVAGVVKDIQFPKNSGVMVNYPFNFHSVGH